MTTVFQRKIRKLLAEIKRLKLENAILRQAAGIVISPEPQCTDDEVLVSTEEKRALLSKIS